MQRILLTLLGCVLAITTFAQSQSTDYDKELGAEYSKAVELRMGVYQDAELTAYVRGIGEKLVEQLGPQPFEYSFKIADSDVSNAFALPGGYTYVTRGLLAMVNDESELACVMAHEIIHVHRRHAIKQMRPGILPGILRLPGQIVGAFSPAIGSILQVPADLTDAVFSANYSRSHEKEADKEGVLIATEAGYDPQGLINILDVLSQEAVLLTGAEEKKSITNDHPITEKRLKYLEKDIEKAGSADDYAPIKVDGTDGLVYGQNPAQGVFDENVFMHPDIDIHLAFPPKWSTANTEVMVGAMEPNGEALFVMSITEEDYSPKQYADTLVAAIPAEYQNLIEENAPIEINGFKGHEVVIADRSAGTTPVYMRIVWLNVNESVFQLTAYGLDVYREAFTQSFESFRKLNSDERNGIMLHTMKFVAAEDGETLKDISERTGNTVPHQIHELMNGVSAGHKFNSGDQVKVVMKKKY